jgi:hypothetical protein
MNINLEMTYSEAKRIIENHGRDVIESMQDQPYWLTEAGELTYYDIQAVNQGGCASGAYMPAVTYHTAKQHMATHGDDILEYIEMSIGEIPAPPSTESWAGMAVYYFSMAVELWCGQFIEVTE